MPPIGSDRLAPNLRAVRTSDAAELCRIANMPGYRQWTLCLPFESVESWEKRIAGSIGENTWLAAEIDDHFVGHGRLLARKRARMAHVGDIVMGVADDFVGRGIGSAILQALLDVADNWRGLKRIELTVYAGNEPATAATASRWKASM